MRTPMIAGNWKMNTTVKEATDLVNEMGPGLEDIDNVVKVICPPFVSLVAVKELIEESSIKLGAQNLYFAEKGAYTGEISPLMLAGICEYVIIGHSERRQYFNEIDEIISKKVRAALKVGLNPILCVGEKLEENEAGKTEEVVTKQLKLSLADVDKPNDLSIAYEPIWAIGTGKAATGEMANKTITIIRRNLANLYNEKIAQKTLLLYGGSVTADNIAEIMRQPEIDGALVGGASLKADQFVSIVRQTSQIRGHQSKGS
jgi:triosephosphate isomerase